MDRKAAFLTPNWMGRTWGILVLIAVLAGNAGTLRARGQSSFDGWEQPVNLSRSGAASQPLVLDTEKDGVRVFWWDQFDGLVTATLEDATDGLGKVWSEPTGIPIPSLLLTHPPQIIADASGMLHAFWNEGEPGMQLMHSQLPAGTVRWTNPVEVTSSALVFDVQVSPEGEMSLAYMRTSNTNDQPAGVYVTRFDSRSERWGQPAQITTSVYFRLLSVEEAWVRLSDSDSGGLYLTWDEPRFAKSLFSVSLDEGKTWTAPEALGGEDEAPVASRAAALPGGGVLRFWQTSPNSNCTVYQQFHPLIQAEVGYQAGAWTDPQPIIEDQPQCPQGDRFWVHDRQLIWLWGEGTNSLSISVWNQQSQQWFRSGDLNVTFEDSQIGRQLSLEDLHASYDDDFLTVVGSDPVTGDVWATTAAVNLAELTFVQPSSWTAPILLQEGELVSGLPSLVTSQDGEIHLAWSQASTSDGTRTELMYAHGRSDEISSPIALISGAEGETLQHPVLLADFKGNLHMVWSAGLAGQLYYQRAAAVDAKYPSAWSAPLVINDTGYSSWPQIGTDSAGKLYVVYTVPLNEERGVYMVRSEDGGKSWTPPEMIFDAAAAGWQMVQHPSLSVEPGGTLHLAWVETSFPPDSMPQSIQYSKSEDGGLTWSSPLAVAGTGLDWPRLALASNQLQIVFSDRTGGAWHRWTPLGAGDTPVLWSTAERIPGWEGVSAPLGLAVDGLAPSGTLHLIGAQANQQEPLYSFWDGKSWNKSENPTQPGEVLPGRGAAAATFPRGEKLAAVWFRVVFMDGVEKLELNLIGRAIPEVRITAPSAPLPIPTAAVILPTATPPEEEAPPTPTPDLNRVPPPDSAAGFPALYLGGGLAAAFVAAGLVAFRFRSR